MKIFRNNVEIIYDTVDLPAKYRPLIMPMLINLASLYRLDYFVEEDKVDLDGPNKWHYDLIYFRSTEETDIDGKHFRKLINDLFANATSFGFLSVNVLCQTQSKLKKNPFPSEFYRPLNYPYVEHHKDNRMLLKVRAAALFGDDESLLDS